VVNAYHADPGLITAIPADVPLSRPHQRDVALQKHISQVTALDGLITAITPDDLHQVISKIPGFGDVTLLVTSPAETWRRSVKRLENAWHGAWVTTPLPLTI
jgi:hypothetical protein